MTRTPTTFIGAFLDVAFGGISFTFDAIIQEDAQYSGTLTKNPIESGAEVNDHFFLTPQILTLNIEVSNTPFNPETSDIVNIASQTTGLASNASTERRVAGLEILKKLQAIAEPFGVQTGLDLFENMLILDIKTIDNAENAGVLEAIVTLQEAIFTETQIGLLTKETISDDIKPQAKKLNKGKAQEDTRRKSYAAQAVDKIFGD